MREAHVTKAGGANGDAVRRGRMQVALWVYVVLALGLAWALALPMWLGDGLKSPLAGVLIHVMMYTPAVAVLIVMLLVRPAPAGYAGKWRRLRFLGMWPLRPFGRTLGMSAVCLVAPLVIVVLTMVVGAAFGWVHLDLVHFSGYAEMLKAKASAAGSPSSAGRGEPPVIMLVIVQLVAVPFAAATVNAIMTFGEELGWRGFLLPTLLQVFRKKAAWLGPWPALLLSGAIWGLWHAPIILLGYNFNRTDIWGVLTMTAGCMCWGVLLGWLRLRTGSMWPAVFAHAGMNASAGFVIIAVAAGTNPNPVLALPLGVAGWIACAIVIAVLVVCGQFKESKRGELAVAPSVDDSVPLDSAD